ncbi:MAG: uracil-DNA glycosylase [Sulfurovaceae bacterium]|nr:uracil-DNA glycosylase [Sulfurovaceae bacterium]
MKNLHNALQLKQLYQLKNLGYRYTSAQPFSYEEQNPLELPNTIEELKKQAQNCHLCSLSKSCKQALFGEGNPQADIMFVGDIPMEIEDNEGGIFLGRGGEMLTLMIEKVLGLSRQKVYLTNLIKCHPAHSQKVEETQFHTCKAYLFKEIALVKPKIIVTLGELAYHYISGNKSVFSEVRGTVILNKNYTIIPTCHPNFLLKNPSFKRDVFEDLKKVKGVVSNDI